MSFLSLAAQRRSEYQLNATLPVSKEEVVRVIEEAVKHSPSAFNSQSARVVVLFGEQHLSFWSKTGEILKGIVGEENFAGTKARIDGFSAGAGTVLFFEDQDVVKGLQESFPLYAENFPVWSEHSSAINQYAIWLALSELGVGANLQHYNPLVDEFVQADYQVPSNWRLRAQLVFGGVVAPAGEKQFQSISDRVKVIG